MNYKMILKMLGYILIIIAFTMFAPLIISIIVRQNDMKAFLLSIILTGIVGLLLSKIETDKRKINTKEGIAIVTFGWVIVSLFGALPFYLSGSIPSYVDCFLYTTSKL
jgi:trk system potassium uptake protein TrkH